MTEGSPSSCVRGTSELDVECAGIDVKKSLRDEFCVEVLRGDLRSALFAMNGCWGVLFQGIDSPKGFT